MNKLLALCLFLSPASQAAVVSGRVFKAIPLNIVAAPSFTPPGGGLTAPSLMARPLPLSGFLETIDRNRPYVALKPAVPGVSVYETIYYVKPAEKPEAASGYIEPQNGVMRPGGTLRKDVKRLKKVLATLPAQIESVWPAWRESLIAGVGMGSDNDVYVDVISRDPLFENHYRTARLVKKGKLWTVAEGARKPSAVDLMTRPTQEGDRHMHKATHALRDSDLLLDLRKFPGVLNRLLSALPKGYASYIIDLITLGVRPQADAEGAVWAKARLSSNTPVTPYRYGTVDVVKP